MSAVDRGLAPRTVANYAEDLRCFTNYCSSSGCSTLAGLSPALLEAYAVALGKTCAVATHIRRLVVLRAFCRLMRVEGWLPAGLGEDLSLPKRPERLPDFLSLRQVLRLLAQPDPSTPRGCRDLAMLETLYACGLRVSELCGLRLAQLEGPVLRVRGKGRKERLVPIGAPARAAIERYLQQARPHIAAGGPPHAGLFLTCRAGRVRTISPRRFQELILNYAQRAGLHRRVWPHLLRHTYATHLLMRGAELRALQLMLGHKSIDSTQVYTHCAPQHLFRVYRQRHPRA